MEKLQKIIRSLFADVKKHPIRWFLIVTIAPGILGSLFTERPQPTQQEMYRQGQEAAAEAKKRAEYSNNLTASSCAQSYIKQMLAPKPTSFPWNMHSDNVTYLSDEKKYMVNSYVDTENDFGGKVRRKFMCFVELPNKEICPTECTWL